MADFVTRITNNLAARRIPYIPPAGRVLENGETYEFVGVLDTVLALANREGLAQYTAERNASAVDVEYDIPGFSGGGGGVIFPTIDQILDISQIGKMFSNRDAGGPLTLTLPPPPLDVNLGSFGFYVANAAGMIVEASAGSFIRYGSTLSSDGGNMESDSVGSLLVLRIADVDLWVVEQVIGGDGGSWSDPV